MRQTFSVLAVATLVVCCTKMADAAQVHESEVSSSKNLVGNTSYLQRSDVLAKPESTDTVKFSGEERGITERLKGVFKANSATLNAQNFGKTVSSNKNIEKVLSRKTIDQTLSDKNLEKVLSDKNLQKSLKNNQKIEKTLSNSNIKRSTLARVAAFIDRNPKAVALYKGSILTAIAALIIIVIFGSIGLKPSSE
ncbi:hypothetical protein F442_07241 [Phytophthora nicotianae P10297]|uniref:RxLR effector protein n=1 Tax=Phytophthora nicotianae P10297 TaxID=1317064 RepID=W2ZHQ7_PHYNI|nr:hypothetical protein F442_07241 [Phytophthora nicotianae P10297]